MSLTPHGARKIRIWVITLCVIGGAGLPFLIPGATAVRAFTDIEARIGYGAFSVIVHAMIGALIGAGLAEFVVISRATQWRVAVDSEQQLRTGHRAMRPTGWST
jgi:hypothetical protein